MTELRKELKDRGISLPAAKKSDMIAKLAEALGAESTVPVLSADLSGSIPELAVDATPPAVAEVAGSAVATSAVAPAAIPTTPSLSSVIPVELSSNGAAAVLTTEPDKLAVASTAKALIKSAAADGKDRLAARAARFGGASAPAPTVSIGSGEVLTALKKRTERFGEVVSSTVKSLEAKEKLNQRASRFNLSAEEQNPTTKLGLVRKSNSSPILETAKRPISAATPEEEERLRKRRERFGLT